MRRLQVEVKTFNSVEIFNKYGIQTKVDNNNMIIISHYCQPNGTTFKELGINEDKLIENVIACEGCFDTRKSELTTLPLIAIKELRLHEDTNIIEAPNLKIIGTFIPNKKIKKLPKLKKVFNASLEETIIKSLPKLKEANLLIIQNSNIEELPALEKVGKLCIIDTPIKDLKNLTEVKEAFICSTNENEKIELNILNKLEKIEKLFVANSTLKSMPKLKEAKKIALYNCEIKSIKSSLKAEVEIKTQIADDELGEKFDTFTDWYNSEEFNKSLDMLGNITNLIQS